MYGSQFVLLDRMPLIELHIELQALDEKLAAYEQVLNRSLAAALERDGRKQEEINKREVKKQAKIDANVEKEMRIKAREEAEQWRLVSVN